MTRTILVHLNVTVPDEDARPVEEITAVVAGALEVGLPGSDTPDLDVDVALAEEV